MKKNIVEITTPLNNDIIKKLRSGDRVLLNGIVYTARDAAHKRLIETIKQAEIQKIKPKLPFDLQNQIIYYSGPAPAKPNQIIGPAGPTTSYRMDIYTPTLLKYGLKGMIGKGKRNEDVIKAMKQYKAVYFAAIGGAAALISECIKKSEIIAYEDLGTEAIRKLVVEKLPIVVINDILGNDLYNNVRNLINA